MARCTTWSAVRCQGTVPDRPGRIRERGTGLRLVSSVVPSRELAAAAAATAALIARAPREVLLRTKAKAVRRSGVRPDDATLAL